LGEESSKWPFSACEQQLGNVIFAGTLIPRFRQRPMWTDWKTTERAIKIDEKKRMQRWPNDGTNDGTNGNGNGSSNGRAA
jgi:hypothetical protein